MSAVLDSEWIYVEINMTMEVKWIFENQSIIINVVRKKKHDGLR